MNPDVVLLCAYPLALLVAARLLHALGSANTSPWASRALAGYRRATGDAPDRPGHADWPHSEVPRLYTVVALVAAGAATALSLGAVALHHSGAEVIAPALVLAICLGTLLRLAGVGPPFGISRGRGRRARTP